ncbi:molybdopterin dinucleotide binding domain-containing protein [Streptomyces violaceoruber]
MLKAAAYLPPHEEPDEEYPFQLTTGRTLYHFHTRTKTGRAPQLNDAAPDVWVEVSAGDAERLGLGEGDLVEVTSRRGSLRGRLRVTGIRTGLLFVPFHYGYWDTAGGSGPSPDTPGRAANETTVTDWDPASKQPLFKTAAAALTLVERGGGRPSPAPTTTASAPVTAGAAPPTSGGPAARTTEREPTEFPHGHEEGAR